jgi:hypothetical protein
VVDVESFYQVIRSISIKISSSINVPNLKMYHVHDNLFISSPVRQSLSGIVRTEMVEGDKDKKLNSCIRSRTMEFHRMTKQEMPVFKKTKVG